MAPLAFPAIFTQVTKVWWKSNVAIDRYPRLKFTHFSTLVKYQKWRWTPLSAERKPVLARPLSCILAQTGVGRRFCPKLQVGARNTQLARPPTWILAQPGVWADSGSFAATKAASARELLLLRVAFCPTSPVILPLCGAADTLALISPSFEEISVWFIASRVTFWHWIRWCPPK